MAYVEQLCVWSHHHPRLVWEPVRELTDADYAGPVSDETWLEFPDGLTAPTLQHVKARVQAMRHLSPEPKMADALELLFGPELSEIDFRSWCHQDDGYRSLLELLCAANPKLRFQTGIRAQAPQLRQHQFLEHLLEGVCRALEETPLDVSLRSSNLHRFMDEATTMELLDRCR
jgi:hypothetical protein